LRRACDWRDRPRVERERLLADLALLGAELELPRAELELPRADFGFELLCEVEPRREFALCRAEPRDFVCGI
jgi:hypothetical protein